MKLARRQFCQTVAAGVAGATLPAWASEDKFPSKPIRIVVPYPAGGQTDTMVRIAANAASQTLGQPVIVENRPGVGGNLGAEMVAKSAPDGYTLFAGLNGTMPLGAALYTKLKYDAENDLRSVTDLISSGAVWIVNSELPVNNIRELIEYSKANPEKVTIGSWGPGSFGHSSQFVLNTVYGAKTMHVPYKGEAQLMTDIMGGQINVTMVSNTAAKSQMSTGKIRAIAFTGDERSSVFPDLPTVPEQGFKDKLWSISGPTGVFAPKNTPDAIVNQINAALVAAVKTPKFQEYAKEAGVVVVGNSAAEAQKKFKVYFDVIKKQTQATGVVIDI